MSTKTPIAQSTKGGGFDPLEVVNHAISVLATHGSPFECGRIDRLDLAQVVESDREPK